MYFVVFYACYIHAWCLFSNFLFTFIHPVMFSLSVCTNSSFYLCLNLLNNAPHSFACHFILPSIPPSFTSLVRLCFLTFLGRQSSLCSPYDIIQCRLQPVYGTVQVLVALDSASLDRKQRETLSPSNSASSSSKCRSLVSVTTQTPPPAWQIWDLIGSSLLHILCLTLLFVAYSWIELT